MPIRRRRKFIRTLSGAATRRRISSSSSRSHWVFRLGAFVFASCFDCFKRLLQDLENGAITRPVRRSFHLDDISQVGNPDCRTAHSKLLRTASNTLEHGVEFVAFKGYGEPCQNIGGVH